MLHLPDDAAKGGDVGAQHAILIHASQGVSEAARGADQRHELLAVTWLAAKFRIDILG